MFANITPIICSLVCVVTIQSSISNAMSSLLPSHPGTEMHYTNSANDVNGVHGYVMLLQLWTSLNIVPMPPTNTILHVIKTNRKLNENNAKWAKKYNGKFSNVLYIQYCVCIAIMLVETKLAMIHLNVPNVIDLYTIYSITHIGMYMRRLTATRLNQNVLRSVNFHSMTSMQIYMSLFTIKVFYELIMPGFLVHS